MTFNMSFSGPSRGPRSGSFGSDVMNFSQHIKLYDQPAVGPQLPSLVPGSSSMAMGPFQHTGICGLGTPRQQSRMSFNLSFPSSSSGTHPVRGSLSHDMKTHSQLNNLYSQRVVRAELVKRPFPSSSVAIGPVGHSGVRVTLEDGRQFLIHKGDNYGISSQTVVVDGKHMSTNWEVQETKSVIGTTVSDFVKAGGKDYNIFFNNCHQAAERMMKQ